MTGGSGDAADLARLVNRAYEVEQFFVAGDRTNAAEIARLMQTGRFLVVRGADAVPVACLFLEMSGDSAHFGMLAVDPSRQNRGVGRRLIEEAESRARRAGCRVMALKVVNLRTDLIAFYERLGYVPGGTEPYEHRPVVTPCHFVCMRKTLAWTRPGRRPGASSTDVRCATTDAGHATIDADPFPT